MSEKTLEGANVAPWGLLESQAFQPGAMDVSMGSPPPAAEKGPWAGRGAVC